MKSHFLGKEKAHISLALAKPPINSKRRETDGDTSLLLLILLHSVVGQLSMVGRWEIEQFYVSYCAHEWYMIFAALTISCSSKQWSTDFLCLF